VGLLTCHHKMVHKFDDQAQAMSTHLSQSTVSQSVMGLNDL
jgi:hypothetical protein